MTLIVVHARHQFALLLIVVTGLVAGCGQNARNLSLNQPKAREACSQFLTAWKEGKKPADLKPKVVGRDSDWEAGKILESFELLPDEFNDGTNLHIKVRQVLKDAKGGQIKQDVIYIVGTSPVVTVFRLDE